MPDLKLTLLGPFDCRSRSGRQAAFPTRKVKALCGYLALSPGRLHSRDELAGMFWGDNPQAKARASLRSTLSRLRKALPEDSRAVIVADGDSVALNADVCAVDVLEFRRAIGIGTPDSLERGIALCQGRLLDGLDSCGSAFEEWLQSERRQLEEALLGALRQLLEHCVRVGAIEQGIQAALRLLKEDPLDEASHRSLIRLYLYQERFGAALQQYEHCRSLLAHELDVSPDPETEMLRRAIAKELPSGAMEIETDRVPETRQAVGNAAALRARQKSVSNGRPVLAILSFRAFEPPAPNYLAEGLAEELAIELGRFRELDIIAPASSAAYAATGMTFQEAGAELGATYVLCGSIRTVQKDVRLAVRLIDAASHRQIWAENYACGPDDLFAVQDNILHRLVAELANSVSQAELTALRRKRTKDWSAYEYWLRGWDRLKSPDISSIGEARTLFDKAIAADPSFARPYVGKALAHLNEWACYSWNHWFFLQGRALEFARTAVQLDEFDNRAQCMLGLTEIYTGDYQTAERCLVRALELNHNDTDVLAHAAGGMALIGDHRRAVEAGERALRLAPFHPDWYVVMIGLAFLSSRRYAEAIEVVGTAPEASCTAPALLAAAHALNGSPERGAAYRDTVHRHFRRMVERGAIPASNSIVEWLLGLDPFQDPDDAEHYASGLRRAGFR